MPPANIAIPICTTMKPNTIRVLKDGNEITEVRVGDLVTVQVYFPTFPGDEWKLYDSHAPGIPKLTNAPLYLDEKGCGSISIAFLKEGLVNPIAHVCGYWLGDTCMSAISRDEVSQNDLNVYVGITQQSYFNREEKFPAGDTYSGYAVKETQRWKVPVLNADEGYTIIIDTIKRFAGTLGRSLLNIKTKISDISWAYQYDIDVVYEKPAGTTLSSSQKISGANVKSMQVQLVPIVEAITPYLGVIITGVIILLALIAIAIIVWLLGKAGTTITSDLLLAGGALVVLALLYKDRDVKSLYSKR